LRQGKTVFLFYILLQRILDAQPTILRYVGGTLIGFSTDKGLEDIIGNGNGTLRRVQSYPCGTWALADPEFAAAGAEKGAPGSELKQGNLFTVTTSPLEEQYEEFQKQRNATLLVMNPFSWEEFLFAA
jgi:hypothetical protein